MRSKLIFGAAGATIAGLGALWGWALTADHWEGRVRDLEKRVDSLDERTTQDLIDNATVKYLVENYPDAIRYMLEGGDDSDLDFGEMSESFRDHPLVAVDAEGEVLPGLVTEDDDFGVAEMRESLQEAAFVTDAPVQPDTDSEAGVETDDEVDEEGIAEARTNLQDLINQYVMTPEDRDEFVSMAGKSVEVDRNPPFVIDQDEFAYGEEGEDYAKITLEYFPREQILLDEEKDPIVGREIDNMVGRANLQRFGDGSGDPSVVFVRNHRLMTDFEIVRDEVNPIPTHVKYGVPAAEFKARKAAGLIQLEPEDT